MKQKCGYTRSMYNPEKEGLYLVKNILLEYELAMYSADNWETKSGEQVIAWIEIPKTDIYTPF